MTTTIYIICAILLLWLIGVDVRYYQLNKKISIMHNTDKNLLELINTVKRMLNEKKEDKPEVKRNNKKRVVKKSKRVRATKTSS